MSRETLGRYINRPHYQRVDTFSTLLPTTQQLKQEFRSTRMLPEWVTLLDLPVLHADHLMAIPPERFRSLPAYPLCLHTPCTEKRKIRSINTNDPYEPGMMVLDTHLPVPDAVSYLEEHFGRRHKNIAVASPYFQPYGDILIGIADNKGNYTNVTTMGLVIDQIGKDGLRYVRTLLGMDGQ